MEYLRCDITRLSLSLSSSSCSFYVSETINPSIYLVAYIHTSRLACSVLLDLGSTLGSFLVSVENKDRNRDKREKKRGVTRNVTLPRCTLHRERVRCVVTSNAVAQLELLCLRPPSLGMLLLASVRKGTSKRIEIEADWLRSAR